MDLERRAAAKSPREATYQPGRSRSRPAESPVALVEREVVEIVPGHEPVPERGHEGGQGQGDEQGRRRPAHPSLGRGRLWALIVHGVAFEQATSSGGPVASVCAIRRRLSQASRDVGDTRRAITKALTASPLRPRKA